ncbi:DinB family protein [Chitinophaga dinghuensis]|uniref:DinB family protein n=1 Tax=Chitinophaga dinghuensis TaxID=1539050 RepID=A0A327VNR2_9BACT|nr:DinB family protein [Chitinophaga dinghuensis]RAJ75463.1 DinB family protein [Chitinophaga dinghuensis]
MSPVNSQQLLQQLKNQVEDIRLKAISRFNGKSDQVLLQSPTPGSWSAIQCLEHLNTFGTYYLPTLGKTIEQAVIKGSHPKSSFHSGIIGGWFTRLMAPPANGRSQSKMKAPKGHRPASQLNVNKVLKEFISQQEEMESLLVAASRIDLEKVKVPLTLSRWIRISVGDTFGFLIAHTRRHILQAEKAIAAAEGVPVTN